MRRARVFYKEEPAGVLTQHDDGSFVFQYDTAWVSNPDKPGISLTLAKREVPYQSPYLFPFFFSLLPEGSNKVVVCRHNRLDNDDYFGILLTVATMDTIGAVRILEII